MGPRRHAAARRHRDEERHREQRRRQHQAQVLAELRPHVAPLRPRGGDGGVRDDGKVVAEHRPADHRAQAERRAHPRGLGDAHRDGRDGRDRPDRRPHRRRGEGGDHEEPRHRRPRRQHRQPKVDRARDASRRLGRAREGARQQEDQAHHHHVGLAHRPRHHVQPLGEGPVPALQEGHAQRRQEGHNRRQRHAPVQRDPHPQEQRQQDGHREEAGQSGLRLDTVRCHGLDGRETPAPLGRPVARLPRVRRPLRSPCCPRRGCRRCSGGARGCSRP